MALLTSILFDAKRRLCHFWNLTSRSIIEDVFDEKTTLVRREKVLAEAQVIFEDLKIYGLIKNIK